MRMDAPPFLTQHLEAGSSLTPLSRYSGRGVGRRRRTPRETRTAAAVASGANPLTPSPHPGLPREESKTTLHRIIEPVERLIHIRERHGRAEPVVARRAAVVVEVNSLPDG